MRPPSTATAALNPPPSSSMTNEVSAKSIASRPAWSTMHSGDARDLVRGPEVDAVPLAVGGDRRQVDRPGAEHQRQVRRDERAHDRAHPADADAAVGLVLAQQHHERELALADPLAGHEREPIAGRAEHELERAVVHERRRPAARDRRPRRP